MTRISGNHRGRARSQPEVRREELLDAAERLFLARGIAATSVDAIVAGADVAKGTFYLHFESKEQLLAALQQRFIDNSCADLRAAIDTCPAGRLAGPSRAWVAAGVDGYLDRIALHDVVFHEFRPNDATPPIEIRPSNNWLNFWRRETAPAPGRSRIQGSRADAVPRIARRPRRGRQDAKSIARTSRAPCSRSSSARSARPFDILTRSWP